MYNVITLRPPGRTHDPRRRFGEPIEILADEGDWEPGLVVSESDDGELVDVALERRGRPRDLNTTVRVGVRQTRRVTHVVAHDLVRVFVYYAGDGRRGPFNACDATDEPVLRLRVQRRTPGAFDWRDTATAVTRVSAFVTRDERRAVALLALEAIGDPPAWGRLAQRVGQLAAMDTSWLRDVPEPVLPAKAA